jgi:hypothetical protein
MLSPKPPPKITRPSRFFPPLSKVQSTRRDIPEVEVLCPTNNTSNTTPGSSQNDGGASSTQTNGGTSHQSPPRAPSPLQVIQDNTDLEQVPVEDWDEEAFKDEAVELDELVRVQQEIERLRLKQEANMRRQAAVRQAKDRR